jgi:hypothetical protein
MQPFWLIAKQKKFEVHNSEPESSDLPPYVLSVHSAALASPRFEFSAGNPSGKEETLGSQPCHPEASSLYSPLASNGHKGREPLGKVTKLWEADE